MNEIVYPKTQFIKLLYLPTIIFFFFFSLLSSKSGLRLFSRYLQFSNFFMIPFLSDYCMEIKIKEHFIKQMWA